MNWPQDPATENQTASSLRFGEETARALPADAAESPPITTSTDGQVRPGPALPGVKIGRHHARLDGKELEIFTMTLDGETAELLPLKNWSQIDVHKWRARGKLPGTPAGLEITPDHVRIAGETIAASDPEACGKLEKLFAEWLEVQRRPVAALKPKPRSESGVLPDGSSAAESHAPRFHVEVGKEGQVQIQCLQGREKLAMIGLNNPGFQSLISQGLMRKPHSLKTGALHDWVELDGVLFSFEKGKNEAERLTQALNDNYLPVSTPGQGKDIVVLSNAASSSGFDIQFPAKVGGVPDHRRRPLDEAALELLQDPEHCGLLRNGLIIKLARPTFIFKQKTPDGGERYLQQRPENLVRVRSDDGEEKVIDISQPVNYLRLSAVELTAVFNHPSINRHTKPAAPTVAPPPPPGAANQSPKAGPAASADALASAAKTGPAAQAAPLSVPPPPTPTAIPAKQPSPAPPVPQLCAASVPRGPEAPKALPNSWIKPLVEQQRIRFDWFACLVYERLATHAGNSRQTELFGHPAWVVCLAEAKNPDDPAFKGVFLTEKSGFGFLCGGRLARFENTALWLGAREVAVKAEDVHLLAVAMDTAARLVFLVSEGYTLRFGVPVSRIASELRELKESGAILLTLKEALESTEALEVLWTVPAAQANAGEPKIVESPRPAAGTPR